MVELLELAIFVLFWIIIILTIKVISLNKDIKTTKNKNKQLTEDNIKLTEYKELMQTRFNKYNSYEMSASKQNIKYIHAIVECPKNVTEDEWEEIVHKAIAKDIAQQLVDLKLLRIRTCYDDHSMKYRCGATINLIVPTEPYKEFNLQK